MEGGAHKGKSTEGQQKPECSPVILKEHLSGFTDLMERECFARSEQSSFWSCPSLAQSLGEFNTAAFDLWVRRKKNKKTSLGRKRRLAARQEECWCWFNWPQGLARPDCPAMPPPPVCPLLAEQNPAQTLHKQILLQAQVCWLKKASPLSGNADCSRGAALWLRVLQGVSAAWNLLSSLVKFLEP